VRPKIGLLLFTAQWFADIGATGGSFAMLPRLLDEDAAAIVAALSENLDVVCPGVLATRAQVAEAMATFEREGVDGVVVCQITWGEDWLVLEALERAPELGRSMPLLVWAYFPERRLPEPMSMVDLLRHSGPVGTLQASGPLKRSGRTFCFAFGSHRSAATVRQLAAFGRAAHTARVLRRAVIGVLPYRCDQMSGTWVDEARLRTGLGPRLRHFGVDEYRAICDAVATEEVEAFVRELRAQYRVAPNVTAAGLRAAARVSLGLAELAARYELDAVAVEDVGPALHRAVGLRPCLAVPALFERAVVSMEADAGASVGLLILKELSGGTPMYTEIFAVDEAENTLLLGHAGMHDAPHLVASPDEILIEPDGEYVESEPDSAWMRFRARGGRVTLLNVFSDADRFRFTVATGLALDGPVRLLGSPHAVVRLDEALPAFFERAMRSGVTQHWALVHADVVDALGYLAEMLGLGWGAPE